MVGCVLRQTGGLRSRATVEAVPSRSRAAAGTVLMETVLVLPLLTLLIFTIIQFALIWYAQIMTHYAAYNAARAALVYHPADYADEKQEIDADGNQVTRWEFSDRTGVCYDAACQTLAWVSSSPEGGVGSFGIPGWGTIPASSHIRNQVRIDPNKSRDGVGVVLPYVDASYTNLTPSVCVYVKFHYPLHIPVIGKMLAYCLKPELEENYPSRWETTGWVPPAEGVAASESYRHNTMKMDYIELHAYCVLPKPWSTSRFARRPKERQLAASSGGADERGGR